MDGKGTVIGFFIYFWVFQISAFVVFRLMNLVNGDSDLKTIIILFVLVSIGYVVLYLSKKSGDRKRAARKANAQYDVSTMHKKMKKRK